MNEDAPKNRGPLAINLKPHEETAMTLEEWRRSREGAKPMIKTKAMKGTGNLGGEG